MFKNALVDHYSFEEVPLDQDLCMMSDEYLADYDRYLEDVFAGKTPEPPGYIGAIVGRGIRGELLDLTWYPNYFSRYHRVEISLPRSQFIRCVGSWQYDEDPHVFVKSDWLKDLHVRPHCVFGLIDAIGIKAAMENERINRHKLLELRDQLDEFSKRFPETQFFSFADSVMFKQTYTVGHVDSKVKYTYEPEKTVELLGAVNDVYANVLGLETYAIITEGNNEFYIDSPLHTSPAGNHISLNSFGAPFAQLMSVERAVSDSLRSRTHDRKQVYMDEDFFLSLRIAYGYQDWRQTGCERANYVDPLTKRRRTYYMADRDELLTRLRVT